MISTACPRLYGKPVIRTSPSLAMTCCTWTAAIFRYLPINLVDRPNHTFDRICGPTPNLDVFYRVQYTGVKRRFHHARRVARAKVQPVCGSPPRAARASSHREVSRRRLSLCWPRPRQGDRLSACGLKSLSLRCTQSLLTSAQLVVGGLSRRSGPSTSSSTKVLISSDHNISHAC